MDISTAQTAQLLSGNANNQTSSVSDLLTGRVQSLASALESALVSQQTTNLTANQQGGLSSLASFVQDNIEGPEAEQLLASIAALEQFIQSGNAQSDNVALDPIFSLLAANPLAAAGNSQASGSLIDQLL